MVAELESVGVVGQMRPNSAAAVAMERLHSPSRNGSEQKKKLFGVSAISANTMLYKFYELSVEVK